MTLEVVQVNSYEHLNITRSQPEDGDVEEKFEQLRTRRRQPELNDSVLTSSHPINSHYHVP